ncbi:recombinase family protein [Siccirubricoccus sp. KC 17139]|uniref:Recombinase family protein n=1 Tax=Siccirubricoccus soli TaxID=2899147 RepID=A0ABT1CYP8_9PROT|nr:recombinase family protein [Siccirubricoccus soli]MCO6414789.1 recombinase family protein [Siccirubricoccus soli]MCP2680919.1 recombinase family protein [Siccirubricoccus soli]
MQRKRKAFSYVRFSSSEQAKGQSLRRQLEASAHYAEQHDLDLDTSLRDLGRSAYKGDHLRGSLGAFREAVIAGRVPRGSVLIVESLDRLSRAKVPQALSQFIQLIEAGIEIVTLMDGRSYSAEQLNTDWTPLIVSLAIMSRAHEESATKSSRISDV